MTESRLPFLAVILGIAGLVPFLFTGWSALRGDPVTAQLGMMGLVGYGAVILAFLGGVHWGFAMEGEREPAERGRLVLGVVPSLIGWAAILLGLVAQPLAALALLILGFVGTLLVEQRAHRRELVPRAYMVLRWVLTVVVVAILLAILCARLIF